LLRTHSAERRVFSANGAGNIRYLHAEKMKLDLYASKVAKIKSK
jgi:hypothetical protein